MANWCLAALVLAAVAAYWRLYIWFYWQSV